MRGCVIGESRTACRLTKVQFSATVLMTGIDWYCQSSTTITKLLHLQKYNPCTRIPQPDCPSSGHHHLGFIRCSANRDNATSSLRKSVYIRILKSTIFRPAIVTRAFRRWSDTEYHVGAAYRFALAACRTPTPQIPSSVPKVQLSCFRTGLQRFYASFVVMSYTMSWASRISSQKSYFTLLVSTIVVHILCINLPCPSGSWSLSNCKVKVASLVSFKSMRNLRSKTQ